MNLFSFFVVFFLIVAIAPLSTSVPPEQPPQPGDQVGPTPLHRRLLSILRAYIWDPVVRIFSIQSRRRLPQDQALPPPPTPSTPIAAASDPQEPPPPQGSDGSIPISSMPVPHVIDTGETPEVENLIDNNVEQPSHGT